MDESWVPQKTTTVTLNVEKLKKTEKKLFSDQDRTTSTTQNFTKKMKNFFFAYMSIQMLKKNCH